MPPISRSLTALIRTVILALAFCFSATAFSPLMASQASDECAAESTEWEEAEAIEDANESRDVEHRTARHLVVKDRDVHSCDAASGRLPLSSERDRLNGCGSYLLT